MHRAFLVTMRCQILWVRSRRGFVITLTDDSAIAAAAMIGESSQPKAGYKMPAARGIPATLETKAKTRFCRMFDMVAFDRQRALLMPVRSPLRRVIPALSIATSDPELMAIPTSAADR